MRTAPSDPALRNCRSNASVCLLLFSSSTSAVDRSREAKNNQRVDYTERFAQNLAAARKEAGYTQEELSMRASIHRTQVGLLEAGKRMPRLDTLLKVAGALGVSPAKLLEGLSWEPGSAKPGKFKVSKT
jgi:DNA-binding XRE family transcriptional regulator